MKRLGLFGGTFDPFHLGHLALARAARRELKLDCLFLVPARISPHKTTSPLASSRHRLAMLEGIFRRQRRFRVDPCELYRKGPSYTYRTVRAFQRRFPGAQWCLVVGGDSLKNIKSWKRWRELVGKISLVVGARQGGGTIGIKLPRFIQEKIIYLKSSLPKISSTDIRSRLKMGRPIKAFVPPSVAAYIHHHRLYGA